MNKNYYTDEYYHNERIKYFTKMFDGDMNESLLNAYAAFCGTTLVEVDGAEVPIIAFALMSFAYLGKSIYDLYKVTEIDNNWKNNKGLTQPLKLKRIKKI